MYEIYTDGATSKNGYEGAIGGYAWARVQNDECIDYASYTLAPATNNICEMMAIIDACEKVKPLLNDFDKVVEFLKISLRSQDKAERQAKLLLKQRDSANV
mgnify:CR=1 FL=1